MRITEFKPAREGRLVVGAGAYIMVAWEAPARDMWLGIEVVGTADPAGLDLIATSFWSGSLAPGVAVHGAKSGHAVCATGSSPRLIGSTRKGWAHSNRNTYPTEQDPDVPFVRLRVWATDFNQACAPPNLVSLDEGEPVIDVIEPLGWKR